MVVVNLNINKYCYATSLFIEVQSPTKEKSFTRRLSERSISQEAPKPTTPGTPGSPTRSNEATVIFNIHNL